MHRLPKLGIPTSRTALLAALIGVSACSSTTGPQGPQGPQGAQGPQGEKGPQGPASEVPGPQGLSALLVTVPESPGENCPNGGVRLATGVDADRDGVLGDTEVDTTSTKYLCNGAPGVDGAPGTKGDKGDTGAPGEPGAMAIYGDGSAGDLIVESYEQPRYLNLGYYTLPNGANLMFRNIRIDGRLFVSSGVTLRATGDIIVNGLLVAQSSSTGTGQVTPDKGLSAAAPVGAQGGIGLPAGRAAALTRYDLAGGGGGSRPVANPYVTGGEGGGRLILAAKGNVTIAGTAVVDVSGLNASNAAPAGQGIPGGGGGGGGALTILSRGLFTLGPNALLMANGGRGAPGVAGATGVMVGGGGGGGGGIVQLLLAKPPSIANEANIQVNGGAAGASAGSGTTLIAGGGGGASRGDGGDGTRSTSTTGVAKAGTAGSFYTSVTTQPELLAY